MSQTLEFSATDGMTLTATRCAVGSYTGTAADSVTQQSGTNRYLAVFSSDVTGAYRLDVKSSGTPIAAEVYDLAGAGTYQPRNEQVLNAAGTRSALGMSTADLDSQLDAIAAKTALIETGSITVSSPVAEDGTIAQIVIGDDYLADYGRAFVFTVDAPSGYVAATSTAKFGGAAFHRNTTGSWNVDGTITDNGDGTWELSFDMGRSVSGGLMETEYKWSVELAAADGTERTMVLNGETTRAVAKQT